MIACFFIKVGTCAPAPKRRLGACGTRKGRVCYEQLRGARPRRRRQAHSHPLYGSGKPPGIMTPSSVHESPAPPSPRSLSTEPVAVSVSSPPPPCGRKRGRAGWGGRTRGKRRGSCVCRLRSARHRRCRPAEETRSRAVGRADAGQGCEFVFSCLWTLNLAVVFQQNLDNRKNFLTARPVNL